MHEAMSSSPSTSETDPYGGIPALALYRARGQSETQDPVSKRKEHGTYEDPGLQSRIDQRVTSFIVK